MKFRYILTAVGLVALLLSCTKEKESDGVAVVNPNPPVRRVKFLTFKASLLDEKYKMKTAIDLDVTHKVIWEKGDDVLIEDEFGNEAIYRAVTGGRDTTTLVRESGDTLVAGSTYKAWYPASYKTLGLPSLVYYDDPAVFREAPMYAEGMGKLDFKAQCGIVRMSYNPLQSQIVKTIVVKSDQDISAEGGVTMDITFKYPNGRTLYPTSRNLFSFAFMPGDYSNLHVELYNGKELVDEMTMEYILNVAAGHIVDVDLNNPEGRFTNLSKYGTANCYLITHSGEFTFVPTKGCSKASVGNIDKVELLWETDNSTVAKASSAIADLSYSGGEIHFTVPDDYTPSNALIVAKDNGGDILWSWHLWICDGPTGVQRYDSEGKMMLMDRVVGGLSAYSTSLDKCRYAAMMYQWGRKDPFPGCTVNGVSGIRPMIAVAGQSTVVAAGPVAMSKTIANPHVFYTDAADYLSEPTDTLWAADHKTIYDPCPVGYRLPPMSAYSLQSGDFYKGWAANYYGNISGLYAGTNQFNKEYYVFPLTNMLTGPTGAPDKNGSSSHYSWTTDITGASQPLSMRLYWADKKVTLAVDEPCLKSDALSVRCMLIQE